MTTAQARKIAEGRKGFSYIVWVCDEGRAVYNERQYAMYSKSVFLEECFFNGKSV